MKNILVLIGLILVFSSCATRDEVVYFKGIERLNGSINDKDYEPVFEENDVLRITVSSLDEISVKPFQMIQNGQSSSSSGSGSSQNNSLTGYLVNTDGYIQFPVLGAVKVAGKKRSVLEGEIQNEIRKMTTDAVVTIRLVNFRITVLGEVGSPGLIEVQDGRMTLPEIFALAGDITFDGDRQNILVYREVKGLRQVGRVDMTSAEVFNNPYYYLKQNDLIYVEPTYRKVKSAGFITSYTGIFSLIASITGLLFLITK
ncbi:polysaccharide biosynthesis/export family protein [Gramella sp. AN32]|uniref:Polysaccharide biosynthesis/export family protein n=1 Tax=Christiangramia antarctica TaxID=2058158 RepID=A0ABW5X2C7_9FLAO|nr:polysaccharide biosynthesis/export family protein [Gramella sp. AN32]MCM4157096.1 sugar transporter [Gramella sp. AN32]